MSDPSQDPDPGTVVARVLRGEQGRCLATLVRHLGDIDAAQDALQDAVATALERWPDLGVPDNPGAWLVTTARNRAIDAIRRRARGRELLDEVAASGQLDRDDAQEVGPVEDDELRLLFMCCHPALSRDAQVALTLRLLGGVPTAEVARAFLVSEPTMAQRLVRAKRRVADAGVPFSVPEDQDLPARVPPVLAVVYLLYNAGADAERSVDADALCAEALRLARLLVRQLPHEPEVVGLLALLLLTEARRGARTDHDGSLVLLRDQDRDAWDRQLIAEGHDLVRACLRRNAPGPYQLQAAINAVHCDAPHHRDTAWDQVLALYDQLLAIAPTPVVALNRAVALGEVLGAGPALDVVDQLELDGYHPLHAVRADLLQRLGRDADAREEFLAAARTAPSAAVRLHHELRASGC